MNLVLAGVAAASLLALFAASGWVPELASHFRLQYALVLMVLGGGYLVLRRRQLALVVLALLAPNAWHVAPYLLPIVVSESRAGASGEDVSVVSLNLLASNDHYSEVRDYLRRSDADLLVLSELSPEWVRELGGVLASYPHSLARDQHGAWGLGVFSRFPLKDAEVTNLGVNGSVNVAATLALPGGDVRLMGVHLVSPTRPARAAQRNSQLRVLAQRLGPPRAIRDPDRLPRLLLGDMNITPFSPHFDDLLTRTGMADAGVAAGVIGTWPTWVPPLQIPIDHCIADEDIEVARLARGPIVGSDHYPIEITLRRRG